MPRFGETRNLTRILKRARPCTFTQYMSYTALAFANFWQWQVPFARGRSLLLTVAGLFCSQAPSHCRSSLQSPQSLQSLQSLQSPQSLQIITNASDLIECVLLPQIVFSYHRMCSLTLDHHERVRTQFPSIAQVILRQNVQNVFSYYRMRSLTLDHHERVRTQFPSIAQVILRQNVQNVFSYYRMCSLTIECVLLR